MLNLCRAVQGVGGAIMFATSLALIAAAFIGRDRGTAFGIYGAVIGGAVAIGPLIGGAITSGIGWRWIFFVNVPIGVVAILITFTKIAQSKDPTPRRIDWVGFVTFSASLFTARLRAGAGQRPRLGQHDDRRPPRRVGRPHGGLLRQRDVRRRTRCSTSACSRSRPSSGSRSSPSRIAASIFAMFLYLTLYIQDDLGYGPLAAGIRFLPHDAADLLRRLLRRPPDRAGAVALPAGRRDARRRPAGSSSWRTTHPDSTWTVLLPGFILCGFGIGIVNPVLASGAISVVQPQRSGMASGANNTFRQVGIATGHRRARAPCSRARSSPTRPPR